MLRSAAESTHFPYTTLFRSTYMIWDDHDIRDDWGSRPADWTGADERRGFAAAADAYEIFQNAHNPPGYRSEEHTSELSHPSISYAVLCLKKKSTKKVKMTTV